MLESFFLQLIKNKQALLKFGRNFKQINLKRVIENFLMQLYRFLLLILAPRTHNPEFT